MSRTSKTLAVLWAVLAVVVVRGVRNQRRLRMTLAAHGVTDPTSSQAYRAGMESWRRRRSSRMEPLRAVTLIAALPLAVLAFVGNWIDDGINWITGGNGSITGFFGSVADDIKHFVLSLIQHVLDGLSFLFNTAWSFIGAALTAIDQLRQWVGSAISAVHDFANNVGQWVWAQAQALVHDAGVWLTALINGVHDFANNVGQWVWAQAQALVHDAGVWLTSLIDAVRAFAQSAADWVWNAAQSLVQAGLAALHDVLVAIIQTGLDALDATLRAVIDGLQSTLVDWFTTLLNDTIGPIQTVIDVVTTVLDWLVALAQFPFTTAQDLWRAWRAITGGDLLGNSKDFVARNGDQVAAHMKSYVAS